MYLHLYTRKSFKYQLIMLNHRNSNFLDLTFCANALTNQAGDLNPSNILEKSSNIYITHRHNRINVKIK